MIIQIYEIQSPRQAEEVVALGVDHVGSVILDEAAWKQPLVRETVDCVRRLGAVSSLIPLFNRADTVFRMLDYYRPTLVHFCDTLPQKPAGNRVVERLRDLQERVRRQYPGIKIMRSIPILRPGAPDEDCSPATELAREFESSSDFFLTDTLLVDHLGAGPDNQPVSGFIGITGLTCDWTAVRQLIDATPVPVILAGGLSPDNVYDGIVRVHPAGVDSCTATNAVDTAGAPIRFQKDLARVKKFVEEARRAQLSGKEAQNLKCE